MKQKSFTVPRSMIVHLKRYTGMLVVFIGFAIGAENAPPANAQSLGSSQANAYQIAQDYVTTFYPLWFTYNQSSNSTANQLVGPDRVSPLYQTVVAVNVDTLYASSFADLSTPAVLSIPQGSVSFSVLMLDPYGDILPAGNEADPSQPFRFTAGQTYVLNGPHSSGVPSGAPSGAIPVSVGADHPVIIFRIDKYVSEARRSDPAHSSDYHSEISEAEAFRKNIHLQSLAKYVEDPTGGQTEIIAERTYAVPLKSLADLELDLAPTLFLSQLQCAVTKNLLRTPGPTQKQATLINDFNTLFGKVDYRQELSAGAQAAHREIVQNYLTSRDANYWIHFDDIGAWWPDTQIDPTPQELLNRASITEYLQYGNNITAASYFHAFLDSTGRPLDGSTPGGYQITFTKEQLPDASRFWSITAYTPNAVELIPNTLNKYHVACYTPGLKYNTDGSLTLYFAVSKPNGVPEANYVPILPGTFNLMLRVYGPTGNTVSGYVPPAVRKAQ